MASGLPTSLADFVGPSRESGTNIVYMLCPVCGSQRWKTYVNPQTGGWYCHASEHSGGGKVDVGLPMTGRGATILGGHSPHDKVWHEIGLPAWEPLSPGALRYLARRGITPEHATRLGMVEMQDRLRIVVPYFDEEGRVIYWNARAYSAAEEGPKYLAASGRHPLYVRPSWDKYDTLFIVEGVFDAIAVEQVGRPCVALGGKSLPRYLVPDLGRLCSRRYVVLLDGSAPGDAMKIRQTLLSRRDVDTIVLPHDEDPSSMGPRLEEYIVEALDY